MVDTGAIAHLTKHISSSDHHSLQRQVLSALSQISKHSLELAEMVVEADIFPAVLVELKGKSFLTPLQLCVHETQSLMD